MLSQVPTTTTRPPRRDNTTSLHASTDDRSRAVQDSITFTTRTQPPRTYNITSSITPTRPPRRYNPASPITPTPPPRRYNTASPITPTPHHRVAYNIQARPPPTTTTAEYGTTLQAPHTDADHRAYKTPQVDITPTRPPRRYNTASPATPTPPPRRDNTTNLITPTHHRHVKHRKPNHSARTAAYGQYHTEARSHRGAYRRFQILRQAPPYHRGCHRVETTPRALPKRPSGAFTPGTLNAISPHRRCFAISLRALPFGRRSISLQAWQTA